jgi:tetratricopeptide (TPR) repeat protein
MTPLDQLSNSVPDLVKEQRFEDALAVCKRLLLEFPEVHDGFEQSAVVHAAMGNHDRAAHFFRKAHAFAADPQRRADYDEDRIHQWWLAADDQERLAAEAERASRADQERAP